MVNRWDVVQDDERQQWSPDPFVPVGPLRFGMIGLCLHYREERLTAVVVDAQHGTQVLADDTPMVGRVPFTIEQWMIARAGAREPHDELVYMDAGVPGPEALWIVIDVQRVGERLFTRPVFIPLEAMGDLSHCLPREAAGRARRRTRAPAGPRPPGRCRRSEFRGS